jgi:hypothetical protein
MYLKGNKVMNLQSDGLIRAFKVVKENKVLVESMGKRGIVHLLGGGSTYPSSKPFAHG